MCGSPLPTTLATKTFDDEASAFDAMEALMDAWDERCVDNERFAFLDDAEAVAKFEDQSRLGCCGSFEEDIMVAGRPARIGCNYGH